MRNPFYPQRRIISALLFSLAVFLCLNGVLLASDQQSVLPQEIRSAMESATQQKAVDNAAEGISLGSNGRALYACNLKIYVVEPVSRYRDYQGHNYEMGFLDFAYDTSLNLDYQVPFSRSLSWDPAANGVSSITENNIMVIAVLFNHLEGFPKIMTDGETNVPFTAYYSDACAAALPGETGYNEAGGGYTHTVFLEEGTQSG